MLGASCGFWFSASETRRLIPHYNIYITRTKTGPPIIYYLRWAALFFHIIKSCFGHSDVKIKTNVLESHENGTFPEIKYYKY